MLDTIGLRSIPGEFIVSKDAPLIVYPGSFNISNGEVLNDFRLFDLEGEEITGSKAILNRDNYQVTIDARGCYIQLSIPKYARGSNYRLSDKRESIEVLNNLERTLADEGISLNIQEAIPGRLDACKNISLEHSTGNYFSFIPSLGGSRMNAKSGYNDGIKRTGFQWSNSRQEIVCYDKRIEMQTRKEAITGIPKNTLRFEHRLRNGRKIKEALGFNTVADMLKDFGRIEENYNTTLKESIFKYEADDKRLFSSRTIYQHIKYALTTYKRNTLDKLAFNLLFADEELVIDKASMLEMFERAMDELNYNSGRKRINRHRLKQKYELTKELKLGKETVNVRELYQELKSKLLKVA